MIIPYIIIYSICISRVIVVININVKGQRGRSPAFNRQDVLEKAALLFWEHGYEGTSIANLTQAMKISPQSLYTAFKSKAELYREALEWYQENVGIFMRRILEEEIDIKIALNKLLRASIVEFTRQDKPQGSMISTAVLSCAAENEDIAAHVAHMRLNIIVLFEQRLNKAVTDG